MIKKSWPWFGSSSYEQGSGSESSSGREYADQKGDSHKVYHSFSAEETAKDDIDSEEGSSYEPFYDNSSFSPVDEIDFELAADDQIKAELKVSSEKLLSLVDKESSILDIGGTKEQAAFILKNGHDVVSIGRAPNDNSDFFTVKGDIRYFNFNRKFDGFQSLSGLEGVDSYRLALENIYSHLKPHSYGIIHSD